MQISWQEEYLAQRCSKLKLWKFSAGAGSRPRRAASRHARSHAFPPSIGPKPILHLQGSLQPHHPAIALHVVQDFHSPNSLRLPTAAAVEPIPFRDSHRDQSTRYFSQTSPRYPPSSRSSRASDSIRAFSRARGTTSAMSSFGTTVTPSTSQTTRSPGKIVSP